MKARIFWAGLLGVGLLLLLARDRPPKARRSVILLMLDTLRADHLGFYGYERDTSPNLDAFARDSIAFKHAFSAAPWTPPSVATMFTGLYPSAHGLMPPTLRKDARARARRLPPELMTLAEALLHDGYRTAAVSPNPWISSGFGFDQGFETFEYLPRRPAEEIVRTGIHLLERLSLGNQPFFLYLHFLDPHDPYAPPEPYASMFSGDLTRAGFPYGEAMLRRLSRYDGEIRYLDAELGRLLSFLKAKGIYDRSLIVVIADHGEQFREHGRLEHGNALHNEELHVPLFVRDPASERRGEVVDTVVSTVDLFPTILGQLDILPAADQRDGVSLFDKGSLARRAGVAAEIRRITDQRGFISKDLRKGIFDVPLLPEDEDHYAQQAAQWARPGLEGLYDIQADYFEQRPLNDPLLLARMRSEVEAAFKPASTRRRQGANAPLSEMSDEVREQLKSLGYLK